MPLSWRFVEAIWLPRSACRALIWAIAAFWACELLGQRGLPGASIGQLVGADRRGRATEDPDDERRQDEDGMTCARRNARRESRDGVQRGGGRASLRSDGPDPWTRDGSEAVCAPGRITGASSSC